jgi:hypothetical protein
MASHDIRYLKERQATATWNHKEHKDHKKGTQS